MSFEDWQRQEYECGPGPCARCAKGGDHDWNHCHCHDPVAP